MTFFAAPSLQAQTAPASLVVFDNVRVFNGTTLTSPLNVLIEGNQIARISAEPIRTAATATYIAGGGWTLMPGLIDAHWHTFMARPSMALASTAPFPFITLLAGAEAEATLLRGFTSVRDLIGGARSTCSICTGPMPDRPEPRHRDAITAVNGQRIEDGRNRALFQLEADGSTRFVALPIDQA